MLPLPDPPGRGVSLLTQGQRWPSNNQAIYLLFSAHEHTSQTCRPKAACELLRLAIFSWLLNTTQGPTILLTLTAIPCSVHV